MGFHQHLWRFRAGLEISSDLTGFSIEALDGRIGTIAQCSMGVSGSYVIVDTDLWIVGAKVMLPGGLIKCIDYASERVRVICTRDEIDKAPDFQATNYRHESYRAKLSAYYGKSYRRHQSNDDPLAQESASALEIVRDRADTSAALCLGELRQR